MKIGLVTIGQAPRNDLLAPFEHRLGHRNHLHLTGALDGLSRAELQELEARDADRPLLTQLQGGEPITLAEERISGAVQRRIDEFEEAGVDLIAVLCTGPFPDLIATVPLILPDAVLRHFVNGVHPKGPLGVIAPMAEQAPMVRDKWRQYPDLSLGFLDPYGASPPAQAFDAFKHCPLVVLDCMGYSSATRNAVRRHIGKPVALAQEVLASAVELLSDS